MLRKSYSVAALSLACALFVAPICGQESGASASDGAANSNYARKFNTEEARLRLAEAAKKQDVDALKKLLDEAEQNIDVDGLDFDNYALAYYFAKLNATEKSPEALEAFARQFRVEARETSAAATVATRVCRDLARYDAELARKLFYEIVDDFARSSVVGRQNYANELCKSSDLLRPFAPSDATVDAADFALADELDAVERRAKLAKITLEHYARNFMARDRDKDFENAWENANNELARQSIPEVRFEGKELRDVQKLLNVAKATREVQTIRDALHNQNLNLYEKAQYDVVGRYFALKALETKNASDSKGAIQAVAREAIAELKTTKGDKATALSRIAREFYFAIERQDAPALLLVEYADALKNSDDLELAQYANAVQGLERFRTLVGEPAILEGVCADNTKVSLDDYRGKAVLVVLKRDDQALNGRDWDPRSLLEKYQGRFAVVEYCQKAYSYLSIGSNPEWKRISRELTAKDKSLGGKEYVDLGVYYGSALVPNGLNGDMAFLVAPDGRVVARGSEASFSIDKVLRNIFDENIDGYPSYR